MTILQKPVSSFEKDLSEKMGNKLVYLKTRQWLVALSLLTLNPSWATALTVSGIRVTVTAKSLDEARTQALREAHYLAFKQLQDDYFPDSHRSAPPQGTLEEMVEGFSINQEKQGTDNKTYTASLTFTFDEALAHQWFQGDTGLPSLRASVPSARQGDPLKVSISYVSHADWNRIKRALEAVPGGQSMRIVSLSCKKADVELPYGSDGVKLQKGLEAKGILLGFEQGKWVIPFEGGDKN